MKTAVLGLGHMGRAIAVRLLDRDHQVTVWNRSKGKASELVGAGATEAADVEAAVRGAEVVITSLANDEAVREVALGPLRSSVGEVAYLDASTVSPPLSAELAQAFPLFAATPILGAPSAVTSSSAVVLFGGDDKTWAAAEPVLSALAATVRRYDTPLQAGSAKLATNLLLLSGVVSLAEAFAVGRSGGLDDDQLRALLGESPMVAPGLKNRFEGTLTGHQQAWWTTSLGAKDARLAVEQAGRGQVELEVTETVRRRYDEAAEEGLGDDDIVAVSRLYDRRRQGS